MLHQRTRQDAITKAQKLLLQKPIYLDTETTGTHEGAEIVEISIIDHDGAALLDTLVQPQRAIPPQAIAIHGITNEMVIDAPSWVELWPQIQTALSGRQVCIYNADFDLRMMRQSHSLARLHWQPAGANAVCLMKLYAQFYGDWNSRHRSYRWQSLENAGRQCGITLPNSHRAQDDALLTRALLHFMAGSHGTA